MSSLETLNTRLIYRGGGKGRQIDRLNEDKLKALKKALLYSYQSATVQLMDGRQFRALINHDKLKVAYQDKIISIPFKDICLNKPFSGEKTPDGEQIIGLKAGDTFKWIPLHQEFMEPTYWIVYLQYSEQTAYFRGEIREAPTEVEINGKTYHAWFKGPEQEAIEWHLKHDTSWNDLNYTRIMYITKNEETLGFFHRFDKLEIQGNIWEVQAINEFYGDNIIKIAMKEYFNTNLPDPVSESTDDGKSEILGDSVVYPYDTKVYEPTLPDIDAQWSISDSRVAEIKKSNTNQATIYFKTSKSGTVVLKYGDIEKTITIKSL